ncbi:hypothetical protein QBC45DRAFT_477120 [Copromyces sp. CBS 386.78]|nr:hypothetical protein QBC45DRAFT_477120 [Copromyces sp. CBS 386.78]
MPSSSAKVAKNKQPAHKKDKKESGAKELAEKEADETTTNTLEAETERYIQEYQNSSTDEEKKKAIFNIMYKAADKLYAEHDPSKSDWVLQRVIQAVFAALEGVIIPTTKKTTHDSKRRFQSRTEGNVLPPPAYINSKAVEKYPAWSGETDSWSRWYNGVHTAYYSDCGKDLDPTIDDHALRACNAILDKLPQEVSLTLRSEGIWDPERRPDPQQLLIDMSKFYYGGLS